MVKFDLLRGQKKMGIKKMENFLFLYHIIKEKSCIGHTTTQTVTFQ